MCPDSNPHPTCANSGNCSRVPPRLSGAHSPPDGPVPPLLGGVPPTSVPGLTRPGSSTEQHLVSFLLSLCLGLFLGDGIVSLTDDSLILLLGVHWLSGIRVIVFLFTVFLTLVTYGLMGFTPMIPKRVFLPVTLFVPVVFIISITLLGSFYSRIQLLTWMVSLFQVVLGLAVFRWAAGGWKLRWPLVAESLLGNRLFSWWNLTGFVLANFLVILPAMIAGIFLGTSLAVHQLSDGFVALRPGGLTVQVRQYDRDDGKTILLVPMSHIGERDFYQTLSASLPTNAVILMEGVTDNQNLLTNKITYERMAASVGLAEQQAVFNPVSRELVQADVDIEEFSTNTIDFMNLVMLSHSHGMTPEVVSKLMQYRAPPGFENQLLADLLGKRNQRLLEELQSRLKDSDLFVVPWGAAHMPEISMGIEEAGFRLVESRDHLAIRFGGGGSSNRDAPTLD